MIDGRGRMICSRSLGRHRQARQARLDRRLIALGSKKAARRRHDVTWPSTDIGRRQASRLLFAFDSIFRGRAGVLLYTVQLRRNPHLRTIRSAVHIPESVILHHAKTSRPRHAMSCHDMVFYFTTFS